MGSNPLSKVWFTPTRGASNWLWLSFFVVLLDQTTKALVIGTVKTQDTIALLPILDIVYLENTGAAFSIFAEASGWQRWFFIGLALTVSIVLMLWLRRIRAEQTLLAIGLSLVLGGALGNVIDRVMHGYVVDRLRSLGAVFVQELDEVPDDATVIFSAHGVSRAVQDEAKRRALKVFDATCPLVTKVHMEVARYAREGREVILIGHAGHPEVEGTMGQFDVAFGGRILLVETPEDVAHLQVKDPSRLAFVTQTTLSVDDTQRIVDALRARFPTLASPRKEDICYATQNRQDAVKRLVERCDLILVVGSPTSSNSNRLREIAEKAGIPGYLIDGPEDLQREWFEGKQTIGVTAGASAPELLVSRVVTRIREWGGAAPVDVIGQPENVVFSLPRELRLVPGEKIRGN